MTPGRILAAGWLVFLLFAYPGYMTIESLDQLMDARVGGYSDWYAPTLSAIWRVLDRELFAGPFGMLLLQSGLFVAGAYSLLRRGLGERAAAIATGAVLLFPPVGTTLAVIWRDAQLAGFALAGAAALLSARRRVRIGGLGLLAVGCTMREGTALLALPLVYVLFTWRDGVPAWARRGIAIAAWLAVVVTGALLEMALTDADTDRQELTRARGDIFGVLRLAEAPETQLRDELRRAGLAEEALYPGFMQDVRVHYKFPENYDLLLLVPAPENADQRAAFLRARRELALAHPDAYLRHRARQLRLLLGLEKSRAWRPLYTSFTELKSHGKLAQHRATHSRLQDRLIGTVQQTPAVLYRPYLYAFLALALLPLALWRRERLAVALLASGLLYELALGFTLSLPEYRHSHWMIACTSLATVMLVAQEVRRRRPAAAPAPRSTG